MGQRERKSLQATRCANGGGEVRQTRRQVAFQLAVRSLTAINIAHRDLPDGGGHPHACMLGACARLRCVIASTRECMRMHYAACIRVCYLIAHAVQIGRLGLDRYTTAFGWADLHTALRLDEQHRV